MTEQELRAAVATEAISWIGTPWRHRARVKGAGVDCGHLPLEVFHRVGLIPFVDVPDYPQDWHLHQGEERYLEIVEQFCERISRPPESGDLVLFRYGKCISHGGIVTTWPVIVHAYVDARAVVHDDVVANRDLARRMAGVWSLRRWEVPA